MSERARELRFLLGSLALVAAILVVQLAGWRVHDAVHDEPTRRALTERCLRESKFLTLGAPEGDPIAESAALGAVTTVVETNPVTIVFAADDEEAAELAAAYRAVGGPLTGRLEVRGDTVYLWERPASPTQRQHLYDCQY
jgi:hypothetical protein